MARVLSFMELGGERHRFPSSPDYCSSLTEASTSPPAASPEYTPVSLLWRPETPEHGPSTTLRLGPEMSSPMRRAASLDYSPSSSPSRPASPEFVPVNRFGWRFGPSTPTTCRAASPDYAPSSSPSRAASSQEYKPVNRCGWRLGSPEYAPSTPTTCRAASPDYAPSTPTYRVASPEYMPVSRLWRAEGSPDYRPSSNPARRAASPGYTPRTPPAREPPSPDSDAESVTSPVRRYRRRHHPYQRSGTATCTWRTSGINHGQRLLVY